MQVGDQDLRLEFAVDGGDRCGRRLMMRPEHQAVRMHEVLDRAALTQKLGVGDHMKRNLSLEVLADDAGDNVAGADGHRALVDDRQGLAHRAGDGLGRLLDEDQVGLAAPAHRRADREEDEVGARDRLFVVVGKTQAARLHAPGHDLLEPGLVDGRPSLLQGRDFCLVDVNPGDLMAELGEAGR